MKKLLPLLCFGAFLFACTEEKKKEEVRYVGPIVEVDNLNIMHSDSGLVKVKMTTAKQLRYETGDERYPKTIYITFIDKNGTEYSRLRGDSGRYERSQNLYVVKGNVLFNNSKENQSLATEELFWNPTTRKIYSEKKVNIKTARDNFTAYQGMDADQDFSRYTLRKSRGTSLIDSIRTVVDTTGS